MSTGMRRIVVTADLAVAVDPVPVPHPGPGEVFAASAGGEHVMVVVRA
jgi:hypothetical protein